jgi:hypothetical protein
MCCYSRVVYRVTLMCVGYCNVLLHYNQVQGYSYVCVTVMCCYSTVRYRVTVMCVGYCNMLLQYSQVQVYCYVCGFL